MTARPPPRYRWRMTMPDLATLFDLAGIAVFAVTGALVASRQQMDIFGFALLGTVTGIGGGTVRDVLLGLPVFWVQDPTSVVVCVVAATLVFFTAHIPESRYRLLLWLDAVGLAAFAVGGAQKALAAEASVIVAVVMGVISAVFGGIIRDVLAGESPLILRRDVYVTAALAGAVVTVAAAGLGFGGVAAASAGFLTAFVIRACAIRFRWTLPVYKTRPARSPEELGL
jgi:uncharacterized membrane protein YeiH